MDLQSLPTELLEDILTLVDIQTLLLAQRVSRQWATCIQEYSKIQQILFFQSAPKNTPRQQNHLLASKLPYWFPADNHMSCAISFGAGDMQDFLESSEAYKRPEASWRRMLVQQPPIMALGWVERNIEVSFMVTMHRWEIPLQAFDRLRMNMLYDLIVQKAEVAPEYFYFRTLWSQHEIYSNEVVVLKSDPDPAIDGGQVAGPLWNAMQSADVVFDMWHVRHLPFHLSRQWGKDTWTWDLVRGLAAPMGDLEVGLVHDMRELKEVNGWSLSTDNSDALQQYVMEVLVSCDGGVPLPDENDPDL